MTMQPPGGSSARHPSSLSAQDLWPETRRAYYMSCRMYRTPEGLRGWPTVEMLREKLCALGGEAGGA